MILIVELMVESSASISPKFDRRNAWLGIDGCSHQANQIKPLFLDVEDINRAVAILANIMDNRLWDDPEYRRAQRVT